MRNYVGWAVATVGLLATVLPAPAAHAATDAKDVVAAMGLRSQPADYVVMVDTSGSMQAGGRYGAVRTQLSKLVAGLNARDRLTLLTFDSSVTQRFRGAVGSDRNAAIAKLPGAATGVHTDIGGAIAAGVGELEKSETYKQAALILITDGKLDAPGSAYAKASSSAWRKLKKRATALGKDHDVVAYAVSLQATTDAGLLKKVFSEASEVEAGEVGKRFAQVGRDLVRLQAARALDEELAQPILVNWEGDLEEALANGTEVPVRLEFVSPYAHVPVQLSDLKVKTAPGLEVNLTGLPKTIKLDPLGRATVNATASISGRGGSEANLSITAKASTTWRKALTKDLGVKFAPRLRSETVVPAAPVRLPTGLMTALGGFLGLGMFGACALLLIRMLTTPSMGGLLSLGYHGRELAALTLHGRKMKLASPKSVSALAGLSGTVTGARGGRRGEPAIRLDAHLNGASANELLQDGQRVVLGNYEVTFTSGRRRVLEKIGLAKARATNEIREDVPHPGDISAPPPAQHFDAKPIPEKESPEEGTKGMRQGHLDTVLSASRGMVERVAGIIKRLLTR